MKKFLPLMLSVVAANNMTAKNLSNNHTNIIMIVVDDMGYGDFGCYGNREHNTPNIDRLADEGILLTDFHTNGVVSSPTRAALMTGRYQQYTGIEGVVTAAGHRDYGLSPKMPTIAKLLKKRNYKTVIFGKWHLGYDKKYNPINHGFDKFVGYVSGNVDYFSHIDQTGYEDWWENDNLKPENGYTTEIITDHAIDYIEKNKETPFFVYIPYEACHTPLQGPNDRAVRFLEDGKMKVKGTGRRDNNTIYKEMVESLDDNVGRIMKTLKKQGLEDNTFIVFFSDNGGAKYSCNKPWSGGKGSLLEGGHRVSSIVRWPNRIKPGSISDETFLTIDLMPTVCEIAGVSLDGIAYDGSSMVESLTKLNSMPERVLFWRTPKGICARKGDWKIHTDRNYNNIRLYNLRDDKAEKNDIKDSNPNIVEELINEIKKWDSNFKNIQQFT